MRLPLLVIVLRIIQMLILLRMVFSFMLLIQAFCDASNSAFCCVVYLKCVGYNRTVVKFMLGKSRVGLIGQSGWVISRKDLEAAKMYTELMLQAEKDLERFNCNKIFLDGFQGGARVDYQSRFELFPLCQASSE